MDENKLLELVSKRPETIKYLPRGMEYPISIYRIGIENAHMQPNIIERIPEKCLEYYLCNK